MKIYTHLTHFMFIVFFLYTLKTSEVKRSSAIFREFYMKWVHRKIFQKNLNFLWTVGGVLKGKKFSEKFSEICKKKTVVGLYTDFYQGVKIFAKANFQSTSKRLRLNPTLFTFSFASHVCFECMGKRNQRSDVCFI